MKRALLNWITIGWAGLLLSSLVSLMAVFMGSASQDLGGLLALQLYTLPICVLAIALYLRSAVRQAGDEGAFSLLWRHTPGWLVFIVLSAASLTLISELTMALIGLHAAESQPWQEHMPAICAVLYALALAMGYATLQIDARR